MCADPLPVDPGGADEFVVDFFAVTVIRQIAARAGEPLDEALFIRVAEEFFGELYGAAGELHHLDGLDAR